MADGWATTMQQTDAMAEAVRAYVFATYRPPKSDHSTAEPGPPNAGSGSHGGALLQPIQAGYVQGEDITTHMTPSLHCSD